MAMVALIMLMVRSMSGVIQMMWSAVIVDTVKEGDWVWPWEEEVGKRSNQDKKWR